MDDAKTSDTQGDTSTDKAPLKEVGSDAPTDGNFDLARRGPSHTLGPMDDAQTSDTEGETGTDKASSKEVGSDIWARAADEALRDIARAKKARPAQE